MMRPSAPQHNMHHQTATVTVGDVLRSAGVPDTVAAVVPGSGQRVVSSYTSTEARINDDGVARETTIAALAGGVLHIAVVSTDVADDATTSTSVVTRALCPTAVVELSTMASTATDTHTVTDLVVMLCLGSEVTVRLGVNTVDEDENADISHVLHGHMDADTIVFTAQADSIAPLTRFADAVLSWQAGHR